MGSARLIYVRAATPADAAAIANLSSELGYKTNSKKARERLSQLLKSQEHGIFVAVDHSQSVIGWVHVFTGHRLMVDPFADLGGLVVTESHRGYGVGNQLLISAENWASSMGLEKVRIRSKVTRERAHKFYSSKDYKTIKSQKIFEKSLH